MPKQVDVVFGAQWGDEGKGRIAHLLAEEKDIVARATGGNNAGHTIKINGKGFALHQLPAGVVIPGKESVMGRGMVVNPLALVEEIESVENDLGISIKGRLIIDRFATILDRGHMALDGAKEKQLGKNKIGTTKKGIGPAYTARVARKALLAYELEKPTEFAKKVRKHLELVKSKLGADFTDDVVELEKEYLAAAESLKQYIGNTEDALLGEKSVLVEGAQGVMLSYLHGTYPFVTSSDPGIGGVIGGLGLNHRMIGTVTGVAKAFTTRVGAGPFPTKLTAKEADTQKLLQGEKGTIDGEFGATTGRTRDIGWLDMVALRYSLHHGGADQIALTKLDCLTGLKTLKVGVGYKRNGNGETITNFADAAPFIEECQPVFEEIDGWQESIVGLTKYEKLPAAAKKYVQAIEEKLAKPIALIGTGPGTHDLIDRRKPTSRANQT